MGVGITSFSWAQGALARDEDWVYWTESSSGRASVMVMIRVRVSVWIRVVIRVQGSNLDDAVA